MLKNLIVLITLALLSINNAFAFVNCQSKYDNHSRSLPSLRGKCNVCHISPNGAGPQNEFGQAFKATGFIITDELVAKFPDLFQKSTETAPTPPITPQIKRIKPNKFKINVQSMATIMGRNFIDGAKTFIDGSEVVTAFKSNVKLVIDFVLNAVGVHQVKVQNPDGQESNEKNIRGR